ncbi:MAG TPA: type II methionyl aminopeptidase [Thermoproteota archaeon]|nr:type II methionyl aminopeptidase [Thermoproteota archaeon]
MASAKKVTDQGMSLYVEAGKIAKKVRSQFMPEVKEGKKLLDFAEELEQEILSQGAGLAFPCNIGRNEVGAHYTPVPSDSSEFSGADLVKVDFGLHLDGYILDTAFSIALSSVDQKLVDAVDESLRAVVENLKVEDKILEVGKLVEGVAGKYRFKVIDNLQGHEVRRYQLHAGLSVPNVSNTDNRTFHEGMAVAIEPFFTYGFGAGHVKEMSLTTIFKSPDPGKVGRNSALSRFNGLPICERWLAKISPATSKRDLERLGSYPVLVEGKGAPIAQAETTLLFTSGRVRNLVS